MTIENKNFKKIILHHYPSSPMQLDAKKKRKEKKRKEKKLGFPPENHFTSYPSLMRIKSSKIIFMMIIYKMRHPPHTHTLKILFSLVFL
jgi:hypothetical protein